MRCVQTGTSKGRTPANGTTPSTPGSRPDRHARVGGVAFLLGMSRRAHPIDKHIRRVARVASGAAEVFETSNSRMEATRDCDTDSSTRDSPDPGEAPVGVGGDDRRDELSDAEGSQEGGRTALHEEESVRSDYEDQGFMIIFGRVHVVTESKKAANLLRDSELITGDHIGLDAECDNPACRHREVEFARCLRSRCPLLRGPSGRAPHRRWPRPQTTGKSKRKKRQGISCRSEKELN